MSDQSSSSARADGGRADPSIAFRQAMAAVETRCIQLSTSIDNHDFEDTEYTAQGAANVWLAGRVACRRLLERTNPASPYGDAARKLLDINGTAILALMKRAVITIEVPEMQRTLGELSRMLTTAMSEPFQPSKGGQGA